MPKLKNPPNNENDKTFKSTKEMTNNSQENSRKLKQEIIKLNGSHYDPEEEEMNKDEDFFIKAQ